MTKTVAVTQPPFLFYNQTEEKRHGNLIKIFRLNLARPWNLTSFFLMLLAIAASVLSIIKTAPLLTNNFNFQDEINIINGIDQKDMPWGILSFTYYSWWRPLGFGIPALLYWAFGTSPFVFHILALCIHFSLGFSLFWFVRRLFSDHIALLAYSFYIISPSGAGLVGFAINAWQDGLFCVFALLGLGSMLSGKHRLKSRFRPYWAASFLLLASALCKDAWIAVLPGYLLMDLIIYEKSSIWERIVRLSPFILLIIVVLLHSYFIGNYLFPNLISWYMLYIYKFAFMLNALIISYLPFVDINIHTKWSYLLLIPIITIILSVYYSCYSKRRIIIVVLTFILLLFLLFPLFFDEYCSQIRSTSMVTYSSIILALALYNLFLRIRNPGFALILTILLFAIFYLLQIPVKNSFVEYCLDLSKYFGAG